MDKILKAVDDIGEIFNVPQEWLEPKRAAVVKILRELKFTSKIRCAGCDMDLESVCKKDRPMCFQHTT